MWNMQTFEIRHLWDHSSGSAVTWDVFRGRWHHTAISGISLWWGVLSPAGWGRFCVGCLSSSLIRRTCCRLFFVCDISTFWKISISARCSVTKLLDVTSSLGRGLSSSTNRYGRYRLGCHHLVMLFRQLALHKSKEKVLPKNDMCLTFLSLPGFSRFQIDLGL